jgi:hypothetical protein
MHKVPLRQLLQRVDLFAGEPSNRRDLVSEVVERRRRRTRNRRTIALCSTLFAIASIALLKMPALNRSPVAQSRPAMPANLHAQVADALLDAKVHELTAEAMLRALAMRPGGVSDRRLAQSTLQMQRDRAALLLVYEADRDFRENKPEQAANAYRRAIELFPTSTWADVARRRLEQIQT